MKASVLFVCLGNICRSPLAEAAFRREAGRLGLDAEVDSAGTGNWHIGRPPDSRAVAAALRQGIDISHLRARQVRPDDFYLYSDIVALDAVNLADLKRLRPKGASARISLLLDYVEGRQGEGVADPYYGGEDDFNETWADVAAGAQGLAHRLVGKH